MLYLGIGGLLESLTSRMIFIGIPINTHPAFPISTACFAFERASTVRAEQFETTPNRLKE